MLEDIDNGTDHHPQSRTLMTVHSATVIAHAVVAVTEAALDPRTTPDPTPLWRIMAGTVMRLGVVHPDPAVSVSSKGADIVGKGMW